MTNKEHENPKANDENFSEYVKKLEETIYSGIPTTGGKKNILSQPLGKTQQAQAVANIARRVKVLWPRLDGGGWRNAYLHQLLLIFTDSMERLLKFWWKKFF